MKITALHATDVHGYLPLNIEFDEDLTFLVGLNGTGKTSALRLLMALLTPNLDELGAITFSTASVKINDAETEFSVSATKNPEHLTVTVTGLTETLSISSSELELYSDLKRREEQRASPLIEKFQSHVIYQRIRQISTPMFLGLDRRFFAQDNASDDSVSRRQYLARRFWPDDNGAKGGALASLVEVNYLVVSRMQEVRAAQEQLDENLRSQFFARAFEYKPSDVMGKPSQLPSRGELETYKKQLETIERAAEGLKIPVPEIQTAVVNFFERMSTVVESLEKGTTERGRKATKKDKQEIEKVFNKSYLDWIINKPQADRILEHLRMLEEYVKNRDSLRDPITRFLSLVNKFLAQTSKHVSVSSNGQLAVTVLGRPAAGNVSALSSGERQLLVMLAHLSLNPSLVGSGVFIVDEPELSLHIDWQEKFVDAVREANPKVQLILATHSPAIILDRVDACRGLNEVARD